MTTDSTTATQEQIRTRLLTFVPRAGATLAATIGATETGPGVNGRLYWDQAPDGIATANPSIWGVMALKNRRSDAENPERVTAELEIQWFARPRSAKATIEAAADIAEQAMRRYVDSASGIVGCMGAGRSPLPPFPAPADRDLAQIQTTFTLILWPEYLTQYHDSLDEE